MLETCGATSQIAIFFNVLLSYCFNYVVLLPLQLSYFDNCVPCEDRSKLNCSACCVHSLPVARGDEICIVSSNQNALRTCARSILQSVKPEARLPTFLPSCDACALAPRSPTVCPSSVTMCGARARSESVFTRWLPNITIPTLLLRRRSLQFIRQHAIALIYNSITPN